MSLSAAISVISAIPLRDFKLSDYIVFIPRDVYYWCLYSTNTLLTLLGPYLAYIRGPI